MAVPKHIMEVYSEVDEFIELLEEKEKNRIPYKIRQIFKEEKSKEYIKGIDRNKTIKEQHLKDDTLTIIAILNLEYLSESQQEKEELKVIYMRNEKEYQEKLREEFNPDDIFKKKEKNRSVENRDIEENKALVVYKESAIKRVINKILQVLRLK